MLSIFSEYLKCYLLFIYVFVCVLCMHARKYQWDPEESVRFPGAGMRYHKTYSASPENRTLSFATAISTHNC